MPGICRTLDMVLGMGTHGSPDCPHSILGFYLQGLQTVRIEGKPVQRLFDIVVTNCPHGGHMGMAIGASGTVRAGKLGVTRVNDAVSLLCGMGMNVLGANTVTAGD